MTGKEELLHASAIAIDGKGVVITGPSGSGKSDLALRLIDRGAILISDDQVGLIRSDDDVFLSAPEKISGKIELRSIGIFAMDHISDIPLTMAVELVDDPARFPMDSQNKQIQGLNFPLIRIDPRPASAPIKVELALKAAIS